MAISERAFEAVELPYDEFEPRTDAVTSLSRLAALHAEAEGTARLANLLGRSIAAAGALAGLLCLTLAAGMTELNESLAWAVLVMLAVGALARCYRRAITAPFARECLEKFAHDLTPIMLYAGFAWGAGAFLALPAGSGIAGAVLFVAVPVAVIAVLLRQPQPVLAFVLPLLALSSFAALLRPLSDGTLAAALMLIAGAVIVLPVLTLERRRSTARALPHLPDLAL